MSSRRVPLPHKRLMRVFETQARHLLEQRYDLLAGDDNQEVFLKELEVVGKEIKKLDYAPLQKGNIPIVIVVSRKLVSIGKQLEKLRRGGPKSKLELPALGRFRAPARLIYPIFNVSDGSDYNHRSVLDTAVVLRFASRVGLLIEEGLALARYYPAALEDRKLYLSGSMNEFPTAVPTLAREGKKSATTLSVTSGSAYRTSRIPSRDKYYDL